MNGGKGHWAKKYFRRRWQASGAEAVFNFGALDAALLAIGGWPRSRQGRVEVKNECKSKSNVKGSGQECPLHTSNSRFLTGLSPGSE